MNAKLTLKTREALKLVVFDTKSVEINKENETQQRSTNQISRIHFKN